MQAAYTNKQEEHRISDAEWDARHQEAVDSAEKWKEYADKLTGETKDQQQQLSSSNAQLQVPAFAHAFRTPGQWFGVFAPAHSVTTHSQLFVVPAK